MVIRRIRHILFILFLFAQGFFFAQDKSNHEFHYYHLVKATATISPGFMLSRNATTMYVHGFLEFFGEDRVSLRGDGFYFAGEQKKPSSLYQNSTLKFGALYHFHKRRSDFYLGVQPGVNFVQPMGQDINGKDFYYRMNVVPILSPLSGITFHVGKWMNFFAEASYFRGRYIGNGLGTVHLDELRISFGLGFNLVSKKKCDCEGK